MIGLTWDEMQKRRPGHVGRQGGGEQGVNNTHDPHRDKHAVGDDPGFRDLLGQRGDPLEADKKEDPHRYRLDQAGRPAGGQRRRQVPMDQMQPPERDQHVETITP